MKSVLVCLISKKIMTDSIKRFLKRIRSEKILNRIGSGRMVYFENPIEEIALRYIPGENGRVGKYYAKHYGRDEYEIDFNSTSVVMGVMEGRTISKSKYSTYHLIESGYWSKTHDTPCIGQDYGYLIRG